ncbi:MULTISPECIES: hypothetical protein [unclassified Modestobacter]|uniref:hypothetical protein n=1 Tax=unclassified Modestobacter TaxID=2643866 RepID=UPI0022AA144A|nr:MULTISPECIES: hypothetical protein [unclassified Modestobacter]MCZ2826183.1 hypothetical protein [Modestobacter sp. VKM Ac-2981]MCZ2852752.1 hypothetical protein [Modestobacter sp. VKM Ac-2982]
MSRYDDAIGAHARELEKVIGDMDDPRHRAILANYRMHGLLEVSGRYRELLAPEMTVEHPHYRLHEGGQSIILDGMAQVTAFYESLAAANALVMWVGDNDLAVNDHGFSGEVEFYGFMPAPMLAGESAFANVQAGDDPDEIYLLKRTLAFVWPYDERGRMIGEHVYEDGASREIIEPDPSDVITAARAKELLAPEIDKVLP